MPGQDDQPADGPQSFSEALQEANDKPKSVLWLVAVLSGLFVWGSATLIFSAEPNGCAMTYMYEYPEYEAVVPDMDEGVKQRFPKYGLYAYGEGKGVQVRMTKYCIYFFFM